MLESKRQTKIKKKLESEGWIVVNLIKTSMSGIPDLVGFKDGETIFIEVKQPKGVLSKIQEYRIAEFRKQGFKCYVWTNYFEDY